MCEKGRKEEILKYIRAPILNSYESNKILIIKDVIINASKTKTEIRSPGYRYKLLGAMIEKNNANQIINEYGSNTLFKRT